MEILYTYTKSLPILVVVVCSITCGICIGLFINGVFMLYNWRAFFCITAVATAISFCLFYFCDARKSTTYYVVTIDDSASFNEIHSQYEIIKVEGELYTLKLKENK